MSSDRNYHGPINPNPSDGEGEFTLFLLLLASGVSSLNFLFLRYISCCIAIWIRALKRIPSYRTPHF